MSAKPRFIYLVGPFALVSAYEGAGFQSAPDREVLTIARVLLAEPEGVPDRRAAVSHAFTSYDLAFAKKLLQSRGHDRLVSFEEDLPANWRQPAIGLPGGPA